MDPEKRARRQSLRIIVSECFMVLAVVITVAILALVVSGYWVNGDFKIERQGMLQISSLPTGADVIVDGEAAWNQRTNTSKVLASGEHTIELKKEGYDSWSRKINIFEGLLYRVHYPRLFLINREKQDVFDMSAADYVSVSPNREQMLIANNTTEWLLLDLTQETITSKTIDVSSVFTSVSMAPNAIKGLFNGKILEANWSSNSERVLIKTTVDDSYEWTVIDTKNPSDSINITKIFNSNFSDISIMDNSASNLIAILDGNLHKINLNARQISAVLVEDIIDYDYYDSEILFSAKLKDTELDSDNPDAKYYIGVLNNHNNNPEIVKKTINAPQVALSRFYDNKYITTLESNQLEIYEKNSKKVYLRGIINHENTELSVGHAGEFQTAIADNNIATIDMEAKEIVEWSTENHFAWLDSDMIYTVNDGELIVYDYNGLNRRVITKNASSHFPVTITNDKWLYYVSDNQLVREKIAD